MSKTAKFKKQKSQTTNCCFSGFFSCFWVDIVIIIKQQVVLCY